MGSQNANMDPARWHLDTALALLFLNSSDFASVFQLTWTRVGFERLVPKKSMLAKFCEISKMNIFGSKISPNKDQIELLWEI